MLRVCCAANTQKHTSANMHKNMQKAHSRMNANANENIEEKDEEPRVGDWCTAWVHTAGTHIRHTRILLHLQHQLTLFWIKAAHTRTHIECAMCTMQNVLSERWDDNNKKKHTPRSDARFYGFCSLFTKHTTKKKANSEKNRHRFFGPIYFHLFSKYNLVSVLFSERSSQKRIQLKRVPLCFLFEEKKLNNNKLFEPLDTKITITFQKTKHKTHLVDFWFEYRLCLFHCMKTLTTLYNCSNSLFLCILRFTKIFFQFALCSTQRFSFGLILVGNFVG